MIGSGAGLTGQGNAFHAPEGPPCALSGCQNRAKTGRGGRGRHGAFCCDTCRARAHKQPELDRRQSRLPFDPPAEPLVPLATPKQIRDAHKPATLAVLRMLQAGPVTTGEFLGACIGRFGARVHELKAVGWSITTAKLSAHSALYTLAGPRDASRGRCDVADCEVCG